MAEWITSRVSSFKGCVFSFPQENKKDGLRLFTEDMVEVKSLPRQSVLDHFIACAPTLVIPYLVSGRGGGGGGGREGLPSHPGLHHSVSIGTHYKRVG